MTTRRSAIQAAPARCAKACSAALAVAVAILGLAAPAASGQGLGSGGKGSNAFASPTDETNRQLATPRLLAASGALVPGETTRLALVFEMKPGWHLYGPYQNDTGSAPFVDWVLPEGFEVGEPRYPVPHRSLQAGNILDHVYKDELVIVFDLAVPPGAALGTPITLEADLEWLVCDDEGCVAELGAVRLEIPVSDRASASDAASRIDRAESERPPLLDADSPVGVSWHGSTLVLADRSGRALAFFPALDGATIENLASSGTQADGPLVLRPDFTRGDRVRGIVRVVARGEEGHPSGGAWRVDLAPGEAPLPRDRRDPAANPG